MTDETHSAALEIRGLSKRFVESAQSAAVVDVSFRVLEGEIVTLLGPSGCGKTTTLRCVAGLETPTSGEIIVGGTTVSSARINVPPFRRRVGLVFQSYALWPHLTVGDNVRYGLRVLKRPKLEVERRTQEALRVVGLEELADRLPSQLSGGQQQRVALARSLVVEPRLLLLDEPLSNLDAVLRERVRTELRAILKRVGIASVYVTHDQREALTLSDRIIVMNGGIIEQVGTPQDLFERPKNAFVARIIGGANILDVARVADHGDHQFDYAGAGPVYGRRSQDLDHLDAAVAVFRREKVVVDRLRPEMRSIDNCWRGRIVARVYEGWTFEYVIRVGRDLVRALGSEPNFSEGDDVWVGIRADDVLLLPRT